LRLKAKAESDGGCVHRDMGYEMRDGQRASCPPEMEGAWMAMADRFLSCGFTINRIQRKVTHSGGTWKRKTE